MQARSGRGRQSIFLCRSCFLCSLLLVFCAVAVEGGAVDVVLVAALLFLPSLQRGPVWDSGVFALVDVDAEDPPEVARVFLPCLMTSLAAVVQTPTKQWCVWLQYKPSRPSRQACAAPHQREGVPWRCFGGANARTRRESGPP